MEKEIRPTPWSAEVIQEAIPHRYPFLLVDRVIEVKGTTQLVALKNVSMSDPNLQGHFPGKPIFPGVCLVEGMAQAAALLGFSNKGAPLDHCLLTGVNKARFRRPVVPGDVILYKIEVAKQKGAFYWFDACAKVDGNEVASCELSAQMY